MPGVVFDDIKECRSQEVKVIQMVQKIQNLIRQDSNSHTTTGSNSCKKTSDYLSVFIQS